MSYRSQNENAAFGIALFFTVILTLLFVAIQAFTYVNFNRYCVNYLERAANAGTIDNAVQNMDKAIEYLKKEHKTEGYTSILYRTPNEDIGYWYKNLCDTTASLKSLSSESTELERSNSLMKLREVVSDKGEIVCPPGLSLFPNNKPIAYFGFFLLACWAYVAAKIMINS